MRSICSFVVAAAAAGTATAAPDAEIKLGACFGYFNRMGAYILMAKVFHDKGYFDDILPAGGRSADFSVSVRPVNTGCNGATASQVAMPLLMGVGRTDGRIYHATEDVAPVVGIAGCTCSSASIAFAGMAVNFKVPMVSGVSTSPALSNKGLYPYFSRVVTPDSMLGKALSNLVLGFGWRRLFSVYPAEPYAQGISSVIKVELATSGRQITYLEYQFTYQKLSAPSDASTFNQSQWIEVARQVAMETPAPRIFFVAGAQIDHLLRIFRDLGLVSSKTVWMTAAATCGVELIQKVGLNQAEYQAADPDDPWWDYPWSDTPQHVQGLICPTGSVFGPKYSEPRFQDFFANVTRAELEAVGWDSAAWGWDDRWLTTDFFSGSMVQNGLAFDSMATLIYNIGTLLASGTPPEGIRGDVFRDSIFQTTFETITGTVGFDGNGDRLAPFDLWSMRAGGGGSSGPTLVRIGRYDSLTGATTFFEEPVFADGTTTVPLDRPAPCPLGTEFKLASAQSAESCAPCPAGQYGQGSDSRCTVCPPGRFSSEVQSRFCVACPPGQFQPQPGAVSCASCPRGSMSDPADPSRCTPCPAGQHQPRPGQGECLSCVVGKFAEQLGAAECVACRENSTRPELWSTMTRMEIQGAMRWMPTPGASRASDCGCGTGAWLHEGDCVECAEGLECLGMDEVLVAEGYASDGALSTFECHGNKRRCPGGPLGACAAGRSGLACAECEPGFEAAGDGTCVPCAGGSMVPLVLAALALVLGLWGMYHFISKYNRAKDALSMVMISTLFSLLVTATQHLGVFGTLDLDWAEPARTILSALSLINFDLDVLSVGCVVSFAPATRYLIKISCVVWVIVVMLTIHMLYVLIIYKGGFREHNAALFGSIGAMVFLFFTSMVTMAVAPFQCHPHPNGAKTVQSYPAVLCGESSDHGIMLGVGIGFLGIPLLFLGVCAYLVRQFPRKVARGDYDFVSKFAFLFGRFSLAAYWYGLYLLGRNMAIALASALPSTFAQALTAMVCFVSSSTLSLIWRPWRHEAINFIDAGIATLMTLMLMCACLLADGINDPSVGVVISVIVILIVVVLVVGVLVAGALHVMRGKRKQFTYFLSHHKLGTGSLARLLKLFLSEVMGSPKKIFIDTDSLCNLEALFDIVGEHTETLVTVLSSSFWTRPWCIGEVVTAQLKAVKISCVICPGYLPPATGFRANMSTSVNLEVLFSRGISESAVLAAMDWAAEGPSVVLPQTLCHGVMSELTEYLQRGSPAGTVLNYVEVSRSPPKVAIVADPSNFQATACALVLCKLLGQACWHDVAMSPGVVPRGEAPLAGATACVMVFSKGAVGQFDFTMAMYQAALHQLPILPIMSEEDFHVLSEQEVTEAVSLVLPALNTAGCVADSKALFSIVSQIFVEIAIRFAPQDGAFSADVLEAKATEVVQRLRGGVQTTKLEVSSELLAKAAAESARRIPL